MLRHLLMGVLAGAAPVTVPPAPGMPDASSIFELRALSSRGRLLARSRPVQASR